MKNILSKIIKTELDFLYIRTESRQGNLYKIYDLKISVKFMGITLSVVKFQTDFPITFILENVSVVAGLSSNTGLQHHFISNYTRNAQ